MCQPQPCAGSTESAQGGRPALELADVVGEYRPAYEQKHTLTASERTVLDAVQHCRTAALGGHVDVCPQCGLVSPPSYNSCHNRHCPKCPAVAQAKWIAGRLERVLPTHCFHVVFTLPAELRGLTRANPKLLYDLLLHCAAETLLELGQDPARLGGELGVTMVLHTWNQKLELHPHAHGIVTGGALSPDGQQWLSTRPDFLFPVRVMGKLFRGKLLDALRCAQRSGQLRVDDSARFAARLASLYRKRWCVYCKRPFGGAEQVIQYLGQYTHRVALSNHRLVAMDHRGVTFRTKTGELVTLDGVTFLDRWLCHVLPPRFRKIRHYGLLAPSRVTDRLDRARRLLAPTPHSAAPEPVETPAGSSPRTAKWRELIRILTGIDLDTCPRCGARQLEHRPLSHAPTVARAPPRAA
jgi:hypothetical protein